MTQPTAVSMTTDSEFSDMGTPSVGVDDDTELESKKQTAIVLVRKHALISACAGVIPAPLIDVATVGSVQVLLVKKLSDLYGQSFSRNRSKAIIAGLAGGVETGLLVGSFSKAILGLGYIGSVIPVAATGGALTYAIGMVFIQHFEMGGTLLDFDVESTRAYFAEQFRAGKLAVSSN